MALMEKTILEATSDFELRIPMTYEQFLTELGEDVHAEWVNGETILFMPPTPEHQDVAGFLFALIRFYVNYFKLGKILAAPLEMKPTPSSNSREPDLLFIAKENLHRLGDSKLEGPADLAVEIISPESVRRDRVHKHKEYEAEGIREYWIIDNRLGKESATFYVLDQIGSYQQIKTSQSGIYRSTVLTNFWINTNWLWQSPQPSELEVFAQIIGPQELLKVINQSQSSKDE